MSQPAQAQAAAPGTTAAAPKATKSKSKVPIDYSSEPSATYLAQLQASSSAAQPPSTAAATSKTKAAAGAHSIPIRILFWVYALIKHRFSGQMAATNVPAARSALVPSYPPGSTPQSALQAGVAGPNLQQPMVHSGMMPLHPHYASSSQAHFGVAAAGYPPSTTPGYYPGAGPANGAQAQYVGGAGISGVGVASASQNQMQFGAQSLSATLSQPPIFAAFPNAHALPPPSSALGQAGVGAGAGQFLPGAFLTHLV